MADLGIIYLAVNTANNKCYIGKTVLTLRQRLLRHKQDAKTSRYNSYFHKAITKYGFSTFTFIVLETVNKINLSEAEIFWIQYFKYIGTELYNMTKGGDGSTGLKHSEETKSKISATKLGKSPCQYYTEELKQIRKNHAAKTYILVDPDLQVRQIHNLKQFCIDNQLSYRRMFKLVQHRSESEYGWTN